MPDEKLDYSDVIDAYRDHIKLIRAAPDGSATVVLRTGEHIRAINPEDAYGKLNLLINFGGK